MIIYKTGNILEEDVEAIVNTVNCVGVMGRGIALQFRKAFPDNYKAYAAACRKQEVKPGKLFIYETKQLKNPQLIINFPTKRHWKEKSHMEDIILGLEALVEEIKIRKIKSIAIPPLGSGLGGLEWGEVRKRITSSLEHMNEVDVIVFEPFGSLSEGSQLVGTDQPVRMTSGRAVLISLIDRYLQGLMDPSITLLEVHKLLYFMQEAGEPLRLQYSKAHYGPYAINLRHVLNAIEGHLIFGYADGGDQPNKRIELAPDALKQATNFLEAKATSSTRKNIAKVAELVEGFETPFGLELLATVHWLCKKEEARSLDEIVRKTYDWNNTKKRFTSRQIEIAYNAIETKGWLEKKDLK